MENQNSNSNFMLYLMLIVCSVLAGMNSLEIYRMKILWEEAIKLNSDYFQTCVKHQYIVKTFFCFFSFFATLSALILTIGLIIDYIYFARKLIESYMNFVYYIFGPTLLISCIFALINWKDTVFVCTDGIEKHFSLTNATSILFCFLIGGVVTILTEFYSTMNLYSNTITRQPEGSKALYTLFWYVSFKIKNSNSSRFGSGANSHRPNHENRNNINSNTESNNNVNSNNRSVIDSNVNLLVRENINDNGNIGSGNSQDQVSQSDPAGINNRISQNNNIGNDHFLEVNNCTTDITEFVNVTGGNKELSHLILEK